MLVDVNPNKTEFDVVTATGVGGMFWVSIRSDGGKLMRGGWNC